MNFLAGFDDWMEEREPGYKARHAAERAQKEHDRLIRRDGILQRYGSEEAALAPCKYERLLQRSLAPWIQWCDAPHQRWTYSIDDSGGFVFDIPPHIQKAVIEAYPLPSTFAEAKAEYDYWRARESEMEDVLGEHGDSSLDRPAYLRMEIVRELVAKGAPVASLQDLRGRLDIFLQGADQNGEEAITTLIRDVDVLLKVEPRIKLEGVDSAGPAGTTEDIGVIGLPNKGLHPAGAQKGITLKTAAIRRDERDAPA